MDYKRAIQFYMKFYSAYDGTYPAKSLSTLLPFNFPLDWKSLLKQRLLFYHFE